MYVVVAPRLSVVLNTSEPLSLAAPSDEDVNEDEVVGGADEEELLEELTELVELEVGVKLEEVTPKGFEVGACEEDVSVPDDDEGEVGRKTEEEVVSGVKEEDVVEDVSWGKLEGKNT